MIIAFAASVRFSNDIIEYIGTKGEMHCMDIRDDAYTWDIDVNLLKTPFILFVVWKVLMLSAFIVPALLAVIDLVEGDFGSEALMTYLEIYLLIAAILTVLAIVGYYAVFIPMAGVKYGLRFKMDDSGVDHIVRSSQRKRNYLMYVLGITSGLSTGNPGVAGANAMAYSRNNMYTPFKKVKKIIYFQNNGIIKLICRNHTRNVIFVKKEDSENIFKHISNRCDKASAIIKKS